MKGTDLRDKSSDACRSTDTLGLKVGDERETDLIVLGMWISNTLHIHLNVLGHCSLLRSACGCYCMSSEKGL